MNLREYITSGRTVVGKLLRIKCRLQWRRHKSLQGTGNVARRQHEQTQWISDINPTYLISIWCRIYRIRTADSDYSQFVVVTDVTRCGPLYVLTIYSSPFVSVCWFQCFRDISSCVKLLAEVVISEVLFLGTHLSTYRWLWRWYLRRFIYIVKRIVTTVYSHKTKIKLISMWLNSIFDWIVSVVRSNEKTALFHAPLLEWMQRLSGVGFPGIIKYKPLVS